MNKNSNLYEISFFSSETNEEIMLAATFYLKPFLHKGKKIKFSIPERIYLSLGEQKFKEIFSDQILEFEKSKRDLVELVVEKNDQSKSVKMLETFKITTI